MSNITRIYPEPQEPEEPLGETIITLVAMLLLMAAFLGALFLVA